MHLMSYNYYNEHYNYFMEIPWLCALAIQYQHPAIAV